MFYLYTDGNLISSYQDYGSSDSGLYVSSINCSSEPSGNLKECNFIANETCSGKPLIVQCVQGKVNGSDLLGIIPFDYYSMS